MDQGDDRMGQLKANDVLLLVALLPVVIGVIAWIIQDWRTTRKKNKALAQAMLSGDVVAIAVAMIELRRCYWA